MRSDAPAPQGTQGGSDAPALQETLGESKAQAEQGTQGGTNAPGVQGGREESMEVEEPQPMTSTGTTTDQPAHKRYIYGNFPYFKCSKMELLILFLGK